MAKKVDKTAMASLAETSERQIGKAKVPDWAKGLRRLYDAVVEEPLPDNFTRLLEQLDKDDNG